jgi:hypothetical protein
MKKKFNLALLIRNIADGGLGHDGWFGCQDKKNDNYIIDFDGMMELADAVDETLFFNLSCHKPDKDGNFSPDN